MADENIFKDKIESLVLIDIDGYSSVTIWDAELSNNYPVIGIQIEYLDGESKMSLIPKSFIPQIIEHLTKILLTKTSLSKN